MAIHTPTSVNYPNGVVTVTSLDSTTYASILESLGSKQYIITGIYLQAGSVPQMLEPIGFFKYDSNGNIADTDVIPTVDPNQEQLALNIDFESKDYVLDGKLYIDYNIRANEEVNIYIENIIHGNDDYLPPDPDFDHEFLKTYGFFEDYSDLIPLRLQKDG